MPATLLAPKGQQLREDLLPALTNLKDIPFISKHIGDEIMPVNLHDKTELEYFTIDPFQFLRRRKAKISAQGAFAISGAAGTKGNSSMDLYRHGGVAKESDIKAKGEAYAEQVATRIAYSAVAIEREIDIAANFADDAVIDPTVAARGQVMGSALSVAAQDPVAPLLAGIAQIEDTIGEACSGVVIPWRSYRTFCNHTLVQARLFGGGYPGVKNIDIPVEKIASMLNVPKVLRPFGKYQTAAGAALTDIWDPLKFYVFFNRDTWIDDAPGLGNTMRLNVNGAPPGHDEAPAMSDGVMMSSYDTPNPSNRIVVASIEQRMVKHPQFLNCVYKVKFPGA